MLIPHTTNEVRRHLTNMGAVNPGRRAVSMVAKRVQTVGGTHFWELVIPDPAIEKAVKECSGLVGDASYDAFTKALRVVQSS